MVNKIKITYFPFAHNHRTDLFYPTDSCRNPLKDILITTWTDFSMGRFDLSPGLDWKKVSLNASKVGNHLPFFILFHLLSWFNRIKVRHSWFTE